MRRICSISALTLAGFVFSSPAIRADVRADQKSHVEFSGMLGRMFNLLGGKGAREGVTSTVAVKGDRKATMNDATGQIIDLAEEKIYDLDLKKKSYKVTTFAELRRRMEEAQKKADEEARKDAGKEKEKPQAADPNAKQMEIDFDLKNTGEKKTINGFETRQVIATVTLHGSLSTDSDGSVVEYLWTCGNGVSAQPPGTAAATVTCSYSVLPASTTYTASLVVRDNCNQVSTSDSITVTVSIP
jgi:hypothetical protein